MKPKGGLFLMMKVLVGIIGPSDLVEQIVNQFNAEKMKNIDYKIFIIQHVEDTRALDNELLDECDLLFFTGQIAFEVYSEKRKMSIVEDDSSLIALRFDGSALFRTLYELAVENKGAIASFTPFTIDVLSNTEVQDSLNEINLFEENVIKIDGDSTFTTNEWANAHEQHYKKGESKYAITCLTSVANELKKRNVPVKRVIPTHSSVNAALELLYANSKVLVSNDLQTTAIIIKWHESDRRPKNRYDFYRQKLKFEKTILDFCEDYKASLTFSNDNQANIYTNKHVFKNYTNHFKSFPLIKELEEIMGTSISVGIGIGDENSKAEYFAEKAIKFSETKKKSSAYIHFSNGNISGPLLKDDSYPLTFSMSLEDDHLIELSKRSNLSAVTISRLLSLLEQNNNEKLFIIKLCYV